MSISLSKLWAKSPLKKIYHALCPRFAVTKKIYGIKFKVNLNDHLQYIFLSDNVLEEGCYEIMHKKWGKVWDIGSNFGLYSLPAAEAGNEVYAFDLSQKVINLLNRSAIKNNLTVTTIPIPITVNKTNYLQPKNSSCVNEIKSVDDQENTTHQSLTYLEVEKKYGTPNLIKMDIEGGEKEFCESADFIKWINKNKISMLIELHNNFKPDFTKIIGAKTEQLDLNHIFINYNK